MKLAFVDLSRVVTFEENFTSVVVLENPRFFREYINELLRQTGGNEGKFVLSDKDKIISVAKNVEVILEPFSLDLNKRKVLAKLYDDLEALANNENFFAKTLEIKSNICRYLLDIALAAEHNIDFDKDFSVKALFTAADFQFIADNFCILDSLVNYCKICHGFLKIPLIVLVNLSNYFSDTELTAFYKQMEYEKISVLILENSYNKKLYNEKLYVIDKDLCEVYCDF